MDNAAQRSVSTLMRTLLFEEMLKPLAGKDDQLASYGIENFARLLAERMDVQ